MSYARKSLPQMNEYRTGHVRTVQKDEFKSKQLCKLRTSGVRPSLTLQLGNSVSCVFRNFTKALIGFTHSQTDWVQIYYISYYLSARGLKCLLSNIFVIVIIHTRKPLYKNSWDFTKRLWELIQIRFTITDVIDVIFISGANLISLTLVNVNS